MRILYFPILLRWAPVRVIFLNHVYWLGNIFHIVFQADTVSLGKKRLFQAACLGRLLIKNKSIISLFVAVQWEGCSESSHPAKLFLQSLNVLLSVQYGIF